MKYFKYLQYVLRHKWFVFLECCKMGIPLSGMLHDLSKFRPSEWFPYAEFFYGEFSWNRGSDVRPPQYIDDAFDMAWLLHQHRNPHHWQFWIRNGDDGTVRIFPMSVPYRKEMLADWRGAGRAITGKDDTNSFYQAKKDRMKLHPDTRAWVEKELGL